MKSVTKTLLGAAVISFAATMASAVTFDVEITQQNDLTGGGATGFVGLTGTGDYDFGTDTLELTILGQTFDGTQDFLGGAFVLGDPFTNGVTIDDNLFFTVLDDDFFAGALDQITFPNVLDFSVIGVVAGGAKMDPLVQLEVQTVPVPAALPLVLSAFGLAAFVGRRRT